MARASRCLDDLSAGQRRVLTLRADSRSRRSVARRLDITVRRVTRLERTGLARLRVLTRRGACSAPVQSTVAAANIATAAPNTAAAIEPRGKREPRREEREQPARDKSGGDGGEAQGGVDTPPRRGGVLGIAQTNPGGGFDLTFPLILLALAACSVVLARTVRRDAAAPLPFDEAPKPVWVPVAALEHAGPELERPASARGQRERVVRRAHVAAAVAARGVDAARASHPHAPQLKPSGTPRTFDGGALRRSAHETAPRLVRREASRRWSDCMQSATVSESHAA